MRKKILMVLSAAFVILIVIAMTVYVSRSRDAPDASVTSAGEVTAGSEITPSSEPAQTPEAEPMATATMKLEIDPNAGELITPTPAPTEPGIAIPGWGSLTLPAGVTEAQVALQNPEANADWYYLTFELRLPTVDEETGEEDYEVIFTTGLIPPGQYCNKVTLNRALEPGEYTAIIHVQPYRMSDQNPTNNADMETVLIVK